MRDAVKDQADLIAISDGLESALGRLLTPADDRGPGLDPHAVLSWDYWNHRFGRDSHVLGSSLHIGDQTFEIIGVGPHDFTGTEKGTVTDFFLPLSMNSLASRDSVSWHRMFLMLKPGVKQATALEPVVDLEQLRQHLSAVSLAFEAECSDCLRGMDRASIDRYLNQKLVFQPAGAGISDLQKGGQDPHAPRRLMRGAIALQVAFCVLVLFLSSLFVTSFQRLENRPLGFSTDRLLLIATVAGKGQLPVVWNQTAEALGAAPGVNSVAISAWPLLGRIKINSDISIHGAPPSPTPAFFLNVSPGWLSTMKIPLLSGRDFRPQDTSPGAAIVNETFARTFFPGQDPIGRSFTRGANEPLNKIVGVTPDIPDHDLREPNRALFYVPFAGIDDKSVPTVVGFATFVLHTDAQNPLALAKSLRQLIAQRNIGLRVSNITTQLDLIRDQTIRERLIAMLAAFFAAVALLLAGIGLYAVLNYSVLQRRREIGIRMAIGSTRAGIVRLVTLDVFLMIALGGCTGVALGFGAARYVASLFYQVKATDADMIALTACAILLTALFATLPAVFRALRKDPTEILRAE